MKTTLALLLPLALAAFAACGGDHAPDERVVERLAAFDGTDMPAVVPWTGGTYAVRVHFEAVTRDVCRDGPWSVRLTVDGIPQEAHRCEERSEATLRIPANCSEKVRRLAIELCVDARSWIEAARSDQEAGLVEVAGTWWTRGNLALALPAEDEKAYRFVVADTPQQQGLFFNHLSAFGVRSDEAVYSGVAYTPEPVPTPLEALPEGDGDPCRQIGDGGLRTPTFGELHALFSLRDAEAATVDGVTGLGFDGGRLFLPFAGACDRLSGTIAYRGTHGGYWGIGADPEGRGAVLFLSTEYAGLDYSAGKSLASVRCVKDTRMPAYLSHTPESAPSGAAVRLTVHTDPGDAERYSVGLLSEGGVERQDEATARQPAVVFDLPANESPDRVVYRILVDGDDTGQVFEQAGLAGYARYVSHAPQQAGYEAFTLTVTCRSDLDAFPVRITDGNGLDETVPASAAQPVAVFHVPENTSSQARTIAIGVNGADTGVRVVQQAPSAPVEQLSVVWSSGYITVREGNYAFSGERERGLYFKYGSRYGMTIDTPEPATGSSYSGTAYAPEPMQIPYAELPAGQVDPCTLVAPSGTWRMPTAGEWEELLGYGFDFEPGAYRCYTDGRQQVYLAPSGSIKEGGTGMLGTAFVRVWSSTPKTDTTYLTLSGGLSSVSSVFGVTVGAKAEAAMMVRCVRSR